MISRIDDERSIELDARGLGTWLESINQPPGLAAIGGLENAGIGTCEQNLWSDRVGRQYADNSGRVSHGCPRGSQVTGAQDRSIAQNRLRGVLNGEIGRSCRSGCENTSARIGSEGPNRGLAGAPERGDAELPRHTSCVRAFRQSAGDPLLGTSKI